MAPKKKDAGKGDAEADRVHVVVRIRPPVRKDEKFGEGSEALQYDKEKNMLFLLANSDDDKGVNAKQFCFDRVLWKDSVQNDAWEAAGMSVTKSAMQGYTGCVMCYGQTGAGKTYTLANDKVGQQGIMIQAFNLIFTTAAEERELKYEVSLAYQQIYLDGISDLLQPSAPVELREDPKEGVYVSGAKWESVTTTAEAMTALKKGNDNRATAATKMNADSSRSHAVLMLKIKCTGGVRTLNGMLYLVDLAGSERVKKSGVEGAAFDEAKAINQSLTTLGRCIEVLASNKKEKPPFRESKLTRLLSNAIGGGAKTTLVVCVAPTMTDQFETVNSLDFGQQAMNVVVRAKVNASTDYGSLTASLLAQRDLKQKPIRQMEAQVLRELAPQLDEVIELERQCKQAALQVETAEEQIDGAKDRLAAAKAAGEAEIEADKAKSVQLLNAKAAATMELEKVLVQLSNDPEMKRIQDEHEREKADVTQRSMGLQEELREAEQQERVERKKVEERLDSVTHLARNLGQTAAYLFQTGAMEEAADFYLQAKGLFESCLGADHPRTKAWMEDMFMLVNAPAIQQMQLAAAKSLAHAAPEKGKAASEEEEPLAGAPEWWMQNLFEMGNHGYGDQYELDEPNGGGPAYPWWMQNLFDMELRSARGAGGATRADDDAGDSDYMGVIFGTPRDGTTTARGGPAFTPRGTLVALSQAAGKSGAAISLGMPKKRPAADDTAESLDGESFELVNMSFAHDWVNKVFLTPRASGSAEATSGDVEKEMAEAVSWLRDNFGVVTPRVAGDTDAAEFTPRVFTPRASQPAQMQSTTKDADDAVFHAAMQATLATPRGSSANSVDDAPMAAALSKSFEHMFSGNGRFGRGNMRSMGHSPEVRQRISL